MHRRRYGKQRRVYRLDCGVLAAGKSADIVLIDAPDGGTQDTALAAIRNGDIAAVGAVITAGEPRFVGRSRNTPATTRKIRVVRSRLVRDFWQPVTEQYLDIRAAVRRAVAGLHSSCILNACSPI